MTLWGVVLTCFLVLAAVALLESLYSVKGGIDYYQLFRRHGQAPPPDFVPPATLIVPCKGLDQGLAKNLAAYFALDYPDFQILFVTTDSSDACVPFLERLKAEYPKVQSRILFSGQARQRGQKIHNLMYAVEWVREADRVMAFGDSDIRPASDWLRYLIATLGAPEVGVATGFRWYLPQQANFASVLRSVWNAGIASLMRSGDCRFAWGGAMAVRREVFRQCRVLDYWANSLSDDYSLSQAIHDHSLAIRFQPRCLSFSYEDCEMGELLNWSRRQLAITRVYDPGLWSAGFGAQMVNSLTLWGGTIVVMSGLWAQGALLSIHYQALATMIVGVYGLGCLKAWTRLKAVAFLFPEEARMLRRHRAANLLGGPIASLISVVAFLRSSLSREIEWRGVRYLMVSPSKTVVLETGNDS